MEATFYDDSRYRGPPATKDEPVVGPRTMKRPMTLDLDSTRYNSKKQKVNTLLTSPDLHMLKIASPELERMIIAQHGLVSATPNQCMYPSKATGAEDRDYHTRDFADALTALQPTTTTATTSSTMYHPPMGPDVNAMPCAPPPPSCSGVDTNGYYQQPASNCTNNVVIPSTSSNLVSTNGIANCYPPPNYYMPPNGVTVKEEPQTVPCMGVTPPLSPIDMENQEKIKLERKRLRNRIAASKCRRRKLERIARLESKVAMLKGENAELTNIVSVLREQVCSLKQQVMDHVRCGCEILNFTTDLSQY